MSPQSILLIDEMVIPDTGASPFSMQLDLVMMAFLGAHERTISLWRTLLEEVGLEITQVHRYDPELEYSILEAVPKKS
jgi:demethylsterigmatocystin 6-O-methyltransferase